MASTSVTFAEPNAERNTRGSSSETPLMATLRNAFARFDRDNSGTLSASEMVGILTRNGGGQAMSRKDAQDVITAFDINGDGVLNYEEFVQAFAGEVGAMGLVHVHANSGMTYAYGGSSAPSVPQVGGSRRKYSEHAPRSDPASMYDRPEFHRAATGIQKVQRGRAERARRRNRTAPNLTTAITGGT